MKIIYFPHATLTFSTLLLAALACLPALAQQDRQKAEPEPLPDLVVELETPMDKHFVVRNAGQADADANVLALGCARVAIGAAAGDLDCTVRGGHNEFSDREMQDQTIMDVPALAAGESVTLEVPYWKQLALDEKQAYRFRVTVDARQQIEESDEDNNTARSQMSRVPVSL